jgi:pentatricopeptide repeat protein
MQNLARAAQWNQGSDDFKWDPEFCRAAVDAFERHLTYLQRRLQEHPPETPLEQVVAPHLLQETKALLSAETVDMAMKAVLKGKMHTSELSKRVRQLERLIGSLGKTPLTDKLSLRLVEANGKSGNIGRVLSLLNLRASRDYPPLEREFCYAVQAIESAGLFLREGRNILLGDALQPDIDNPTRWLDAILTNMHKRNHALSVKMANRMLNTYASTGRTSKALHFFYYISRQPMMVEEDPATTTTILDSLKNDMPTFKQKSVRVKMKFRPPPKYYKVPSESRGKLVAVPGEKQRRLKLDLESDPNWSLALTAAFSFADSLTHGACGHFPIELDVVSWNTLIKACCYRGSLWRAMQLLKDTMPQQGIEPNTISYNTILAGLARVVRDIIVLVDSSAIISIYRVILSLFLFSFCLKTGRHCDHARTVCHHE